MGGKQCKLRCNLIYAGSLRMEISVFIHKRLSHFVSQLMMVMRENSFYLPEKLEDCTFIVKLKLSPFGPNQFTLTLHNVFIQETMQLKQEDRHKYFFEEHKNAKIMQGLNHWSVVFKPNSQRTQRHENKNVTKFMLSFNCFSEQHACNVHKFLAYFQVATYYFVCALAQGSPNYDPRAKSGPQRLFIRPADPFI